MTAPDPARLRELAARVQRATGPDRELDRLIDHYAAYAPQPDYHLTLSLRDEWDVAAYTASLDAAASLVPEGLGGSVGWPSPGPGKPWAKTMNERELTRANAFTPALALLAAALLAMAHDAEAGR